MEKIRKYRNFVYVVARNTAAKYELPLTDTKQAYEDLFMMTDKEYIANDMNCDVTDLKFIPKEEYEELERKVLIS